MSHRAGASKKGFIKNLSTGKIKSFQFNPEVFEHSRGATYAEIVAPGMSYPKTQFVKGNAREFSLNLFFFDKPCTYVIKDHKAFLEGFLPPETNSPSFSKPPEMLICYGDFIKKCVLTELSISNEEYDRHGNAVMSRFTLSLRQVGI